METKTKIIIFSSSLIITVTLIVFIYFFVIKDSTKIQNISIDQNNIISPEVTNEITEDEINNQEPVQTTSTSKLASRVSVDTQSTDSQSTDTQSTDTQSTNMQTTNLQSTDSQSTDTQSTDTQSTYTQSTDTQSTDTQSTDTQSTDTQSTDTNTNIQKSPFEEKIAPQIYPYNKISKQNIEEKNVLFFISTFNLKQNKEDNSNHIIQILISSYNNIGIRFSVDNLNWSKTKVFKKTNLSLYPSMNFNFNKNGLFETIEKLSDLNLPYNNFRFCFLRTNKFNSNHIQTVFSGDNLYVRTFNDKISSYWYVISKSLLKNQKQKQILDKKFFNKDIITTTFLKLKDLNLQIDNEDEENLCSVETYYIIKSDNNEVFSNRHNYLIQFVFYKDNFFMRSSKDVTYWNSWFKFN
jgi:cell division protein FtsN